MSLRTLSRKVKIDILKSEGDICELLFANKRAQHACRLFLNQLKHLGNAGLTRKELSCFANDLQAGNVEKGFSYSRTRFYYQIRRTLLTLGLMAIEQRFVGKDKFSFEPCRVKEHDVVEKYVAVWQPIPRRPPDGVNLVRLMWIICRKWNEEFIAEKDGDAVD